jgi:hypothetical protein
MENGKTTWRITLKTLDGQPITTFLADQEAVKEGGTARAVPLPNGAGDDEARMTDPQRRYLFRLLAVQGVDGKQAEAHLKKHFNVSTLRDVSKAAASEYINQLASDRKEAHGP